MDFQLSVLSQQVFGHEQLAERVRSPVDQARNPCLGEYPGLGECQIAQLRRMR